MSNTNRPPLVRSAPEFTKENFDELLKLLPRLGMIARISEKMYLWGREHRWQVPAAGWEELRRALNIAPLEEPSIILTAAGVPATKPDVVKMKKGS